jgi:DNA-binding GntR family transcriptional regulator
MIEDKTVLNLKPLRQQVYEYLRDEMNKSKLLPGETINLTQICRSLGISKTPLRDALIQLEAEGFVTILPRRSVKVNALTLPDVKCLYEIVGALEASVICSIFEKLDSSQILRMENLNSEMRAAINQEDFDTYYDKNLEFHDVYLKMSGNLILQNLVEVHKQRLYDFPRPSYIKEWELNNCDEHQQLINSIKKGDRNGAAGIIKDVHWSFEVQEKYIREFYSRVADQYKAERSRRQRNLDIYIMQSKEGQRLGWERHDE